MGETGSGGPGEMAKAAFDAGARASLATVFVSSGGASLGIAMAWAGSEAMGSMLDPRKRSALVLAVELALPGWFLSVSSLPSSRDTQGMAEAGFSLSPIEGRADSSLVRKALRPGPDGPSLMERALGEIDAAVGARSARFHHEHSLSDDLRRGRGWDGAIAQSEGLGGLGALDLAGALAAQVAAQALGAATPEAASTHGARPRLGL